MARAFIVIVSSTYFQRHQNMSQVKLHSAEAKGLNFFHATKKVPQGSTPEY